MTSFPALENAVVLKKAPASDATILEVLRDIPAEEWDEYFPEDEAPLKKYPQNSGVIDDEDAANDQVFNVKLAAAFGVVQMMRSFEAMPTMSHADKQIRQRGALKDFNRNFDLKLPEGVELGEITLPNFGPLEEHDEDPLEACNRSLQMARCLKEMNYATKWPWAARKAQPLAFFDVSSQVPFWMSPRSRPAPSANVSTRMVPKSFTIEWQKNKGPDALALLNKLDDKASTERFDVPTSVQKVASDPRVYDDDARWRDSVRRQFNCEVAEMQIDRLLLQAPVDTAPQSPMDKFYLYGSDEITKEWSDIKDMLDAHPLERLRFLVEMRALEPGEDLYESKLPAIQLDGMFGQMGNGDLIMMQPNEDGENVAEEEEPPTEGGTQELPSFSGLDTSNLDTLKDFPDRAAFLHHYNGLDINDPVQRLKWQRQTFQWLSRGITGKQHEKRNDANLPAGEREVLQEAYTEGHAHAVSQEVSQKLNRAGIS